MTEAGAKTTRATGTLLSTATIGGRTHRIWQQNCHDAAYGGCHQHLGTYWGLVLDGCGSKTQTDRGRLPSHNEVGAKLSGQFVHRWWQQQLGRETRRPLAALFPDLYRDYLAFLGQCLALIPWEGAEAQAAFCSSHLLATLVGFVVTPAEAAFYWRGDGYLCHDGLVKVLDAGNRPAYPAYELLADGDGGGFHSQFLDRERVGWLAVASDGWRPPLLAGLAPPRPSLALRRWLNVQARERGNFEDDGAVAVLYLGDREVRGGKQLQTACVRSPQEQAHAPERRPAPSGTGGRH